MGQGNTYEYAKRNFFKPMKRETAVLYAYNNLQYKDQKRLIRELTDAHKGLFYIDEPLPKSYSSFISKVIFVPNEMMKGLGCLVNQLLPYRSELYKYVCLKNNYENHFLKGEYEACYIILDAIDSISLSLWSLEQRVHLAFKQGGSKKAMECKDEIAEKSSPLVKILLQMIWTKVEARYSLSPTEQQLYLIIHESKLSDNFSAYYKYLILKDETTYKYEDCMWLSLMSSVFDIYDFILDAIAYKSQSTDKKEKGQIRSMLSDLEKHIHDERIIGIRRFLGFGNITNIDEKHSDLLRKYESCDYNSVYSHALKYIIDNPRDFDIIDIYVKSAIYLKVSRIKTGNLNRNTLLFQILTCLFSYLNKDSNREISLGRLKVMANQLSTFKTGNCLCEKIKYYEDSEYSLDRYSMNVGYNEFSMEDRYTSDSDEIVKDDRIPVFVKQRAVSHWFGKMVDDRQDFEAIRLYLTAYFNNPQNTDLVDTEKIIRRHNQLLLYLDYPSLETSVFYALIGAPHYMCYHFFKKYIKVQNTQIPSKLLDGENQSLSPLRETFYNKVCSLETIKNYIKMFPDSDKALRERLLILTKLSKIHRNVEYLDEMTVIKRKMNAKQRVQNLDQRMIYVDETALKEMELEEVKKQFGIYKETESTLETKQFLVEADQLESAAMLDVGKMKFKTERVKYKNYLFRQMFMEIRRQFLTSYKFGLDFYLSTRIRHGTLVRQLRRAFEENKLVTNKKDGEYKVDYAISERILGLSGEKKSKVQLLMKEFSKEIDEYIYFIKNEIVQVQAKDLPVQHPKAAFNFDELNTEVDITGLYLNKISQITDYTEFVEVVLAYLWTCTDIALEAMRDYLDRVKVELAGKIVILENHISEAIGESNRLDGFLDLANHARDGMIDSIDKVKMWFYRGQCDDDDFMIRDVIDACKESVSIHRNVLFEPSVEGNSETLLKGEYFRKTSDLILILFNNIIDYIEMIGQNSATCVLIKDMDDIIEIEVSNEIRNEDISSRLACVKKIEEKLGKEEYLKNSNKDKGYGLIKAYNMIHNMLPYDEKAFVLNVKDNHFSVTFRLDVTYWNAYENSRS